MNGMRNVFGSVHYNSIGVWLRKEFNCQVSKLSLDGGFTCPNRDGSKGLGGCIFCGYDGSGHFSSSISAVENQIHLLSRKWPKGKYIAYFQSFTSTYAPPHILREKYEEALSIKGVVGLAIATRPDCLSMDIINVLHELSKRTFLWVELGLQTIHDETALLVNRCYPTKTYDKAVEDLNAAGIKTVTHLIFGLPGETRDNMFASAAHVAKQSPFGIKLHHLYLMKGSSLAESKTQDIPFMTRKQYIDLVVDVLEIMPQSVTVHRLTGDAPIHLLIEPIWSKDKRAVLNGIQQEFKRRGTYQGIYSPNLPSL